MATERTTEASRSDRLNTETLKRTIHTVISAKYDGIVPEFISAAGSILGEFFQFKLGRIKEVLQNM